MKTMMALLAAATTLAFAMPASATTFVDTGTQTGNGGGGSTLATYQYLAGEFTLGSASVLTDVQAYIGSYGTDTIRVSLHADAANLPGASLYSATFTALANGINGAWQGVAGQTWALTAGTYWVSFDNLTGFSAFVPNTAPMPLAMYAASGNQGVDWVASPSNFGLRVSGNVGAVPEPASWAMMILGMGAVGFAMRSGKRRSDAKFDAKIKRITYGAVA